MTENRFICIMAMHDVIISIQTWFGHEGLVEETSPWIFPKESFLRKSLNKFESTNLPLQSWQHEKECYTIFDNIHDSKLSILKQKVFKYGIL